MRFAFALPAAFAAQMAVCGLALADYDSSQAWFGSLTQEQRAEAQTNLILLDDYYYLVDGQFGTGTFNALVEFQRSQGSVKDGVLTEADQQALMDLAQKVKDEFGIETLTDDADQVSITIPTKLVPQHETTAEGTRWSTEDGGMTVETIFRPSQETSFADLFDALSKPGKGRIVTSKSFSDTRFVITGHQDGRDFYTMYKKADNGSVGYQLTWSLPYAERGNILSIYIASNFRPLASLPPATVTQQKSANGPVATRRFGPFLLPVAMPDVIALDGEVSDNFYEDFESAIAARPEAKIMLLNSPGGYVDYALAVAREVHERGMSTLVEKGRGCYSACSYIFFAGLVREADGELGVHQISADVDDDVLTQTTLADVIDALDTFGVQQAVIVQMLRTHPEDMYVISPTELSEWGVNAGGPIQLAAIEVPEGTTVETTADTAPVAPDGGGLIVYVQLAQQESQSEAERALEYARDRWASMLGDAVPEIHAADLPKGTVYRVRVPAPSVERANSLCSAIKSAGGGCYVTQTDQ
jgi:peptidoglycan hydrolase-like protein with peptidoglycan-binding domain